MFISFKNLYIICKDFIPALHEWCENDFIVLILVLQELLRFLRCVVHWSLSSKLVQKRLKIKVKFCREI